MSAYKTKIERSNAATVDPGPSAQELSNWLIEILRNPVIRGIVKEAIAALDAEAARPRQ